MSSNLLSPSVQGDTIIVIFQPSDQVLAVAGVSILDDMVAEVIVENFQLQINVPSVGGFSAGSPANVFIRDDECKCSGNKILG